MKKLIALTVALLSLSAFATDLNENMTWSEIKEVVSQDYDLSISYAPVFLGQPISAFDTCIEGDMFKTTRKFPIYKYVRTRGGKDNDRTTRVKIGEKFLSYPIVYTTTKRVCERRGGEDKNCRYEEVVVEQDLVKNVTVSERKRRGGDRKDLVKVLFTKTYEIPSCK